MPPRNEKPDMSSFCPSKASSFSHRLRTWRRLNNIKQAALAEMLNVSQAAISFWESGRDMPSLISMQRLEALMASTARDAVWVEQLFVERQAGIRALFDYDGARMIAASRGFHALWPQVGTMEGVFMADRLVNEARKLVFDEDLRHAITRGDLGLASGISERMTDLEVDPVILHGWHMCFRRYGHRTIIDIVYETCSNEQTPGVKDLVYISHHGASAE